MRIIDFELLRTALPSLNLSQEDLERMDSFAQNLLETNSRMNLTAITDSKGVTLKHFADSLSLLCVYDFKRRAKLLDLGTGGGFPGVPLLLSRPDLRVTFLDSTQKKLRFVESALNELNVRASFLHLRAEDAARFEGSELKCYDIVTARAVAPLPILCGWALPFLKEGGAVLAMKGPAIREEILASKKILTGLNAEITDCLRIPLPEACGERYVAVITKGDVLN